MENHKYRQSSSNLLFIVLLCNALPIWSTTIAQLDLQDMASQADLIIVGQCTAVESVWVGRTLYTRYTLKVEDTVHGETKESVRLMVPGGIDPNRPVPIAMSVAGAPVFFPDERDVLLLTRMRHPALTDAYSIVGFNQGRFKIQNGSALAHNQPQQKLATDVPVDQLVDKLRLMVSESKPLTSSKKSTARDLIGEETP